MIGVLGFLCENASSVNLVDGLVGVGLGFRASIVDIFPHKITLFDFLDGFGRYGFGRVCGLKQKLWWGG